MADERNAKQKDNGRAHGTGNGTVAMLESTAWLQLDLADYLRMPRPMSIVDKRGREALRKRISRQLKQQEYAGDPLRVVATIRRFMVGTEPVTTDAIPAK